MPSFQPLTCTLLTETDTVHLAYFLGETLGLAVLDSGCSKTVCGQAWLKAYHETLSVNDRQLVKKTSSSNKFRFGDGATYSSIKYVTFPIYIQGKRHFLSSDVVTCDVPLLLSRESLERADAEIYFGKGEVLFLGKMITVVTTLFGHYCLPLTSNFNTNNKTHP